MHCIRLAILTEVAATVCFFAVVSARAKENNQVEVVRSIIAFHRDFSNDFRPSKIVESFVEWPPPGHGDEVVTVTEWMRRGDERLVKWKANAKSEVVGANHGYHFRATEITPGSGWSLNSVRDTGGAAAFSPLTYCQAAFLRPLMANEVPIAELLTHSNSRIISCQQKGEEEDNRTVEIKVQVDDPSNALLKDGKAIRFPKMTLVFAPEKYGWIPTKTVVTGRENDSLTFFNDKFAKVDGYWVPSEFRCVARLRDGTKWQKMKGSFEYGFDEVPEEVFRLSHYGLPEPAGSPSTYSRSYRLWVMVFSVLIFAILFYRFLSRQRGQTVATQ